MEIRELYNQNKNLFTAKQQIIIEALLHGTQIEDICIDSKGMTNKSFGAVVGGLNRKFAKYELHLIEIETHNGCGERYRFYQLDLRDLKEYILLETFEEEETTDQEIEETPAQKPAVKKPRKLKASTIKAYSNDQLINHLDKLQGYLEIPAFRIDTMIRYYNASNGSYWPYCSKHERQAILIAIDETHIRLNYELGLP